MRELRNLYTVGNYCVVVASYEEPSPQEQRSPALQPVLPLPLETDLGIDPDTPLEVAQPVITTLKSLAPQAPVNNGLILRMNIFEDRRGDGALSALLYSAVLHCTPESAEGIFNDLVQKGERIAKEYHCRETNILRARSSLSTAQFLGGPQTLRQKILEEGRRVLEEVVGRIEVLAQMNAEGELEVGAQPSLYQQIEYLRAELDQDWEQRALDYQTRHEEWKQEMARQRVHNPPQRPKPRAALRPLTHQLKTGTIQTPYTVQQAKTVLPRAAPKNPPAPPSANAPERLARHRESLERARQRSMGW